MIYSLRQYDDVFYVDTYLNIQIVWNCLALFEYEFTN